MSRRFFRFLPIGIALVLAVGFVLHFSKQIEERARPLIKVPRALALTPISPRAKSEHSFQNNNQNQRARPVPLPQWIKLANSINGADHDIEEDLSILATLLSAYQRIFQVVPSGGLNEEIIDELTGTNAKRLAFIGQDHPALIKGALTDRWGSPFYFHPLSRTEMEIRSAGPDKELWTSDDAIHE